MAEPNAPDFVNETTDVVLSADERAWFARQLSADVEAYTQQLLEDGPRSHLGASLIGKDCSRHLWYTFRWVKHKKFAGRMLRLFNRGHKEEARFVEWLRGVGFNVMEYNPNEPDKQFRIIGIRNHFGGSLDGLGSIPERYITMLEKLRHIGRLLFEFKTHNEKSYTKLAGAKDNRSNRIKPAGVAKAKPEHYAQMCMYGTVYKIKYGIYCAVNKDTDELYFEIVPLDWKLGAIMERKAEDIINSQTPPEKLHPDPTWFGCKFCDHLDVCHNNEPLEVNCRSCANAMPVDNGKWQCAIYGIIPHEFIIKGCAQHRPIV